MSIRVTDEVELEASPRDALELVLDLHAYRSVDRKITKVRALPALDGDGRGTAEIVGRLWHFPPAPDRHLVHLEPWHTLTFEGAPRVPARAIFAFTGRFEAHEVASGTRLVHSYVVTFRQPLAAMFDRPVETWMAAELREEMVRLQARLGPTPPV